jgi:hypothetical protein
MVEIPVFPSIPGVAEMLPNVLPLATIVIVYLPPNYQAERSRRGAAIDVGDQDGLRVDAGKLHDALDRYGLPHTFEVYSGTHTSAMGGRFQNNVMPFFSQRLCATQKCE